MPTIRINKENENAFHFLTLTTIEWVNIFTKPLQNLNISKSWLRVLISVERKRG